MDLLSQNLARSAIASCGVLIVIGAADAAVPAAAASLVAAAARGRRVVVVGPRRGGDEHEPYVFADTARLVCVALRSI